MLLLRRLALVFPPRKKFRLLGLVDYYETCKPDTNGLVPGLEIHEARLGVHCLLGEAWDEIARTGYVSEATWPWGNGWFEITDDGWAVLESNTVKVDDDYISTILP